MMEKNPYVGPKPFEREDRDRFFGRDTESKQLVALIKTGPALLLYAESGAGKTSLLKAKIIPTLEEDGCEVLGPVRVAGVAKPRADGEWENIYSANVLLSFLAQKDLERDPITIEQYLKNTPPRTTSGTKTIIRPPRVLIIDQFEEMFTIGSEAWAQRTAFFQDLGNALDSDPRLRLVLGMREEYIANLDPLAFELPGSLRTRFRLERLRAGPALEAITFPLKETGVSMTHAAAQKLVTSLRMIPARSAEAAQLSEFVEPLYLQVVCKRLWNSLDDDISEITEAMIHGLEDVDEALIGYYDDAVKFVADEVKCGEGIIRAWFERELITESNTRGNVFKAAKTAGSLPNTIVTLLENQHLIRAEFRGGAQWYELSHDRMIVPVLKSNRRRRESQDSYALIQRVEKAGNDWILKERHDHDLLESDDLTLIDGWTRSREGKDYVWSRTAEQYIQASRTKQMAQQTKRKNQLVALLALIALFMAGLVYVFWDLKAKADRAVWSTQLSVAKSSASSRKFFDSLAWSINAFATLKRMNEPVPDDVLRTLKSASLGVGDDIWLRTRDPIESAAFSSNGRFVLTVGKNQTCKWNLSDRSNKLCVPTLRPEDTSPRGSLEVPSVAAFISNDGDVFMVAPDRFYSSIASSRARIYVVGKQPIAFPSSVIVAENGRSVLFADANNREPNQPGRRKSESGGRGLHFRALKDSHTSRLATISNRDDFDIDFSGTKVIYTALEKDGLHIRGVDLTSVPFRYVEIARRSKEQSSRIDISPDGKHAMVVTTVGMLELGALTVINIADWTYRVIDLKGRGSFVAPLDDEYQRFAVYSEGGWVRTDDGTAPMRFGEIMTFSRSSGAFLFGLETNDGHNGYRRWELWRPAIDWTNPTRFKLPETYKSVRIVTADERTVRLGAIENGAGRVLNIPSVPVRELNPEELFGKGCDQLKFQPEWSIVKDVCLR